MLETRLQAGVAVKEAFHLLRVARHDHGQVAGAVRHFLDQDLDHFASEVLAVIIIAGQGVGLVDEEHPAAGVFDHLPRLRGGLPDVLPDQIHPVGHHRVP